MSEVFEGLRVLDLTWGTAGPITTMLMADYGADVVKVEPPGGDPFRRLPAYTVWNRGKRSVCLDLRTDDGRRSFDRLAADADVLVESFRPRVASGLGAGYDRLSAFNPRLVYCSITGYGCGGALGDRPGYDGLVQARSGLQFEQPGLRPGPTFLASPLPSYGAALLAAIGIGAALRERETSGAGQHVETSLLQGVQLWTTLAWSRVERPTPTYYAGFNAECRDVSNTPCYEAGDGLWIHPMTEVLPAVLEELGLEPKSIVPTRDGCEGTRQFQREFQQLLLQRPRQRWLELMWEKDLRAQPVLSVEEAFAHPQLAANGLLHDVAVPGIGTVSQFAHPYRIAGHDNALHGPPHDAGADAAAVLDGVPDHSGDHVPDHSGDHASDHSGDRAATNTTATNTTATTPARARGPLAGLRVLDFGLAVAGPYGPMLLSDLGADVIRIENARGRRPPGSAAPGAAPVERAARPESALLNANQAWVGCMRGKRSISLDLKEPDGLAVAQRLIATADVIHHNMRPGAAERLLIGFEDAKRLNPRIVYCHVTGFGSTGPLATFPGCDQMAQALSGMEHEQGATPNGGHPTWHRIGLTDHAAATVSVLGTVNALWIRERTGEPQLVETSILSAATLLVSHMFLAPEGTVTPWHLDREQTGLGPMYRLYRTRDGWICIACVRDDHRSALLGLLGVDRDLDDEALTGRLVAAFATRSAEEWFTALDAAGIPCECSTDAFNTTWYDDPDLRAAGLVSNYPVRHPVLGHVEQLGRLWQFSATPVSPELPPVLSGEHSEEILGELGYEPGEIEDLVKRGVAVQAGRG